MTTNNYVEDIKMNHGVDSSIIYRVSPKFTSGGATPRDVDYRAALYWANAEREAHAAQCTDAKDRTAEAIQTALRGIVEALRYRGDKIEYQDMITDERGVRDNPEYKRLALLTEKNESIIANALRVAADQYKQSSLEFQHLSASNPLQATKLYLERDILHFLGWMCTDVAVIREIPMETFVDAWQRWRTANGIQPNPRLAEQFLKQEQEARALADAIAEVGLLIENQ